MCSFVTSVLASGTLRQYDATGRCFICSGCMWSASGHEGADAASDDGPADGAVAQAGGAVATHHQVTTGDEYDWHQLIHADFTGPLLLQLPQQLLWARLIDCDGGWGGRRGGGISTSSGKKWWMCDNFIHMFTSDLLLQWPYVFSL